MSLAVLSGSPAFAVPQHVGGPIVEPETRSRFHRLCDDAFDRNYLTNAGPLSERLEAEVAARHGVREAVFMANATIAQMVLMKAMGLAVGTATGGTALVSANTFISTAHICEWLGLRAEFVDIDPATLNMDTADLARRLGPDVRAVIPTHVFGVFADLPEIIRVAKEHGAAVLADAAHAFDCDRGGVAAGGFGVPEFLSFHATKYFSTLEGGTVLTNDSSLAQTLRDMRNFGFNRPGDAGLCGTNAKASEINAAFGLASLPALPGRWELLREIREIYKTELAGIPGLAIHDLDAGGRNNYRYFTVFINEEKFGLSRDAVHDALKLENVLARSYFHPGCHRMGYYAGREHAELANTDRLLGSILSLPTSFVEVEPRSGARTVARLVGEIQRQAERVAEQLKNENATR